MNSKLLILWLGLGTARPALAQTGRIAHFSHGGSAATLATTAEAADNFGDPPVYFIADSIRYLSPITALSYGRWSWRRSGNTDTMRLPEAMSKPAAARYWHQLFVNAKLTGFDSLPGNNSVPPAKPGRRRKRAALLGLPALPPASPGLLVLVGLAGAGWLLAGRRPVRLQVA